MKLLSFLWSTLTILAGFGVVSADTSLPTYSAKVLVDSMTSACTLIHPVSRAQRHRAVTSPTSFHEERVFRQNRESMEELLLNESEDAQAFIDIYAASIDIVRQRITYYCPHGVQALASNNGSVRHLQDVEKPVIRKIVDSGNPSNRIDVVFMGDGYTAGEQDRFFEDMQRLTDEMFSGETFAQYLPVFNIWAVFVPSAESGIGVGGRPKNTAFGLYRDGTELRGVYVSKPQRARDVCAMVGNDACDFPSLIANDDFYGGLGGEFVVATRSNHTGTMVLRHEMGHNFGRVGEEYDGGYVYNGANSVRSLSEITWKHWLTEPSNIKEQKSAQLYQKHIWHDLKEGSYKITFTSTGEYKRWYIILSASGVDTDDSLSVTLDGKPLAWKSNGLTDRSFYSWEDSENGFTRGKHELVIKAGGSFDSPIIKQLCNAAVYEYAGEDEYKMRDRDYIGVYATYDIYKRKSYRPNHETCLMRNMSSPVFCKVCQENMWHKFMERLEFIDDVVIDGTKVEVKAIPLGQLRGQDDVFLQAHPELWEQERYTVEWFFDDVEMSSFRDHFEVDLRWLGFYRGPWKVRVTFETPNVRSDPKKLMVSEYSFEM